MIKKKTAPYAGTKKDPDSTIGDINKLLRSYGVENSQWTTIWSKNLVELKFAIETEPGKHVAIKVLPPPFLSRRKTWNTTKGRYEVQELPNWSQSLRLLYYWLKVKLESIAYGLREVEEEFLSDVVVLDERGRETTIGAIVRPALDDGRLSIPALKGGDTP